MKDTRRKYSSPTPSKDDATLSSVVDKLLNKRTVRATLTTDGNSYPVKLRRWTRGTITVKPDMGQLFGREADEATRPTSEASDTSPPEDVEVEPPVVVAEVETGAVEAEVRADAVEAQTESEAVETESETDANARSDGDESLPVAEQEVAH